MLMHIQKEARIIMSFFAGNSFSIGEDGGLLVDEKMRTTEKNVYAAGDVCTPGWPIAPHWFQVREKGLLI